MIQQVLSRYHLPLLTCFGLILFVLVFVGALFWVYRRGAGRFYESMSALPLNDEKSPT